MWMKRLLTVLLITSFLFFSNFTLPAIASDMSNGAEVFSVHCAGCHINGGNIIRRGKNLHKKALQKYGMDSVEAIASIVTNGKNNMSAYKDRLTSQQIEDVAVYVLEQAETGWR